MKTEKIIKGLAMHLHHNRLFEYCYDFDERVRVIKKTKPANEQPTRLRLFKMLSKEAILALPQEIIKSYADWNKAYADYNKAYADWGKVYADRERACVDWKKADADRERAYTDWKKADAEWGKAYVDWDKADAESWHKKYCGCSEWDGSKIIF